MDRSELEKQLAEYPLYRYEFIGTNELTFSEKVRHICEQECPMYGKTWACPPAVGSVESCEKRVRRYRNALLISTVTEVNDIANLEETLATRAPHEALTHEILNLVRTQTEDCMALSTEACALCGDCAWPDAPCRHPDKMFPCVESHGILVTALAEKVESDFFAGSNLVTWFSLILYNDGEEAR